MFSIVHHKIGNPYACAGSMNKPFIHPYSTHQTLKISKKLNFNSMTPSGSQLHNSNSGEVVTPYWSTISHVLPTFQKVVCAKNLKQATSWIPWHCSTSYN